MTRKKGKKKGNGSTKSSVKNAVVLSIHRAPDMIDMLNGGFVALGESLCGSTTSGRPSLVRGIQSVAFGFQRQRKVKQDDGKPTSTQET